MTATRIFSDSDLDTSILVGKQIGIVGYGSQGRAQALNLRDSGFPPLIGVRKGKSYDKAVKDGFAPVDVGSLAAASGVVVVLTPDETQPDICDREIIPRVRPGCFIGFAAGFAVHFGLVRIPANLKVFLVAPKGPGEILRVRYEQGRGIPALVAAAGDDSETMQIAMAYAKAIGCARTGVIPTTFREEAVADLFGEQCVLSGGLIELMKAAFDTLVARGYPAEVAYIECISEVEYMASLISRVGLSDLASAISSTAYYGGVTRGRRVVDEGVRRKLEGILDEIEDGTFFGEFRKYIKSGKPPTRRRGEFEALEKARLRLDEVSRRGR